MPLVLLVFVWAGTDLRAGEADDQFAVAAGQYAQQRWKLAVAEFQAFVDRYPEHSKVNEAVFYLAEALLQTGDYREAGSRFRQYLSQEPGEKFLREALFRAGEAAYLAGENDLAKTDLAQFRSKYPEDKLNAYVLPYLGDIALGQGDDSVAAEYFRRGLTRFPLGRLQDDCRFGLARTLERQGQNEEAERLYLAVAAKSGNPLADDAQFHLGALQYAVGKYAPAIETLSSFESTLAESPWQAKARLGRGWALVNLDRLDEAKAVFQSVVSDPEVGVDARYWLGMAQRTQKDWGAAAETLLAAARTDPQHQSTPKIRFYAGDALLQTGDPAAARKQFDLVVSATGSEAIEWVDDALRGKIQAALQTNDDQALDRAAAEFQTRCPQSPLSGDVHRMLAQSLLKRGRYDRARELLDPLVAVGILDEQGLTDRYLLAQAHKGLERYEDALAMVLPVLDQADGRLKADAQLTQASLLVAMRRYDEAIQPLKAYLAAKPSGDGAVKGLGELAICYARTGRLDQAKAIYAELLQDHPGHHLIGPTTEQLAEAAYEANDGEWSAQLFNQLRTDKVVQQSELKGLLGLGWSQFKADKLDEAAAAFAKLLDRKPPADMAAEAAMARGQILQQLGRSDPALAMYDLVVDKYPKAKQHPQALWAAAQLRDKLQRDQEAATLYQRLATQYPKFPQLDAVLYQWAWVLEELGNRPQSNELFERLRREHPQSRYWADGTFRLAQRAFAAKDYQLAGALTSEVLAGPPDAGIRQYALYLRGQIAVVEEDWPRVREAFEGLIEEFPQSSNRLVAEFWIAEAVYRQDQIEEAGRRFDRLASQTLGRRDAWLAMVPLRRAQVLAHRKKWNEAYAVASKIEAAFPNFQQQHEVDYLIGRCLASRADFDGAREAYKKVLYSPTGEKTETAAMAQWMIGETYFHQKKYDVALREYLRLEQLYDFPTWQAASLLQAGKCRELLGERDEADKLYVQLLKEHPDTPFAEEARRRLRTNRETTSVNPL